MSQIIRLYVDHALGTDQSLELSEAHAHYLLHVMRRTVADHILLFDGHNGEWRARIEMLKKRKAFVRVIAQTRPQQMPPDLWLCFAPIKKTRTDFIVEKAAELGVARICPMQTDFTNSERINQVRLQAHVVEAVEQCGGTYVPQVDAIKRLDRLLDGWDKTRNLFFCDEALVGEDHGLTHQMAGPAAIFIGPEGGFSDKERARLRAHPAAHTLSLGPRILRADTAAIAALTLWQNTLGDW